MVYEEDTAKAFNLLDLKDSNNASSNTECKLFLFTRKLHRESLTIKMDRKQYQALLTLDLPNHCNCVVKI